MPATATATLGRESYRTEIKTRTFTVIADEPADIGGTDTAPHPVELVTCGLAGCIAVTVRMYADRKGWPLERITVNAHHDRRRDGDTGPLLDYFEAEFRLEGDLSDEQLARLTEIAAKCPVHKMLHAAVPVSLKRVD